MDLTQIVAEMKKDARQPAIVISAHELTLAALVELANRLTAIEQQLSFNAQELAEAYETTEPVKRGPGRPRKAES